MVFDLLFGSNLKIESFVCKKKKIKLNRFVMKSTLLLTTKNSCQLKNDYKKPEMYLKLLLDGLVILHE